MMDNCCVQFYTVTAIVGVLSMYFLRRFIKGGVCTSKVQLNGKTVIVTGCNTGIGKETVLDLSKRGAKVIMACRNLQLANKAADDVRNETHGNIVVYQLDLADLDSVRKCAKEINEKESKINILINNAGLVMMERKQTKQGFEMQMGTNHLGHFLFTNLLLDKIKSSGPGSRIVNVSSVAHEDAIIDLDDIHYEKRKFKFWESYSTSKLANVLFTKQLAKQLQGSGVNCYSLHPGVIASDLWRQMGSKIGPLKYLLFWVPYFMKDTKDGAQTNIFCAIDESIANDNGKYYADCKEKRCNPLAEDDKLVKNFWDLSMKEVGLVN